MLIPEFLGAFASTLLISFIARLVIVKLLKKHSNLKINLLVVSIAPVASLFGNNITVLYALSAVIIFFIYQREDKKSKVGTGQPH